MGFSRVDRQNDQYAHLVKQIIEYYVTIDKTFVDLTLVNLVSIKHFSVYQIFLDISTYELR